jgi:hypothetical protein
MSSELEQQHGHGPRQEDEGHTRTSDPHARSAVSSVIVDRSRKGRKHLASGKESKGEGRMCRVSYESLTITTTT